MSRLEINITGFRTDMIAERTEVIKRLDDLSKATKELAVIRQSIESGESKMEGFERKYKYKCNRKEPI